MRLLLIGMLTAVSVLAVGATAVGAAKADKFVAGAVGSLGKLAEDGKSFEFKSRTLPGKVLVEISDSTEYMQISMTSLKAIKAGTTLYVLGIPQEAAQRVGPQISGIRAIVTGDFKPPEKLPKALAKIKGLAWISGSLKIDGKTLQLDEASLSTGANRPVAEIKKGKREVLSKKKATVYVGGPFFKKEKGEKRHRVEAEAIFLVDRKVPKKEYEYYFFIGLQKEAKSNIDI